MWSGRTGDGWNDVIGVLGSSRKAAPSNKRASSKREPPPWPKVGVIIPTRDRADLLSQCVYGLKEQTDYSDFEVVIVDNGSTARDARALLGDLRADPRFTVLEGLLFFWV
jgi:cellulose synthase/poly-beta-1,6-N-acetylglucosamine synthase-like glycosyltransferase